MHPALKRMQTAPRGTPQQARLHARQLEFAARAPTLHTEFGTRQIGARGSIERPALIATRPHTPLQAHTVPVREPAWARAEPHARRNAHPLALTPLQQNVARELSHEFLMLHEANDQTIDKIMHLIVAHQPPGLLPVSLPEPLQACGALHIDKFAVLRALILIVLEASTPHKPPGLKESFQREVVDYLGQRSQRSQRSLAWGRLSRAFQILLENTRHGPCKLNTISWAQHFDINTIAHAVYEKSPGHLEAPVLAALVWTCYEEMSAHVSQIVREVFETLAPLYMQVENAHSSQQPSHQQSLQRLLLRFLMRDFAESIRHEPHDYLRRAVAELAVVGVQLTDVSWG